LGPKNSGRCGQVGGRCLEVIYVMKAMIRTSKWWSLETGGRYLEVVVSSGLTVYLFIIILHYICFLLWADELEMPVGVWKLLLKIIFFSQD
jgi:hypothetical protein